MTPHLTRRRESGEVKPGMNNVFRRVHETAHGCHARLEAVRRADRQYATSAPGGVSRRKRPASKAVNAMVNVRWSSPRMSACAVNCRPTPRARLSPPGEPRSPRSIPIVNAVAPKPRVIDYHRQSTCGDTHARGHVNRVCRADESRAARVGRSWKQRVERLQGRIVRPPVPRRQIGANTDAGRPPQ